MKNTQKDDGLDELNGYLVRRINLHVEAMRRMTLKEALRYLRDIIEKNDVVIGVFVDTSDSEGIGVCVIKGTREMQVVAMRGRPERLRIDAVPCDSLEQAVVAARLTGDRPRTTH